MNTHLLPEPAADETLYSWITRYHLWSANPKIEQTLKYLFDSPHRSALFSNSLARDRDNLNQLARLLGWTYEKIITDFTPYYYEALFNSSYGIGDTAHFGSSIVLPDILDVSCGRKKQKRLRLRDGVALRLCPQCIADDTTNNKIAYWHICHQLHGVSACHIHGSKLLTLCETCNTSFCSHQDIKLPSLRCRCIPDIKSPNPKYQYSQEGALHFARLSAAAVQSRSFPLPPLILSKFYQEQGYKRKTKNSNAILKFESSERIINRFGIELISEIHGKKIGANDIEEWLIELHAGRSQHTYRHILLIGSLFNSFEEFTCKYLSFLNNYLNNKHSLSDKSDVIEIAVGKKMPLIASEARELLTQLLLQDNNLTRSGLSKLNPRLYKFFCTTDAIWFRETLPTKTTRRDGTLAEPGRVSTYEGDRERLLQLLEKNPTLKARDLSKKYTRLYRRMLLRDKSWLKQTMLKSNYSESKTKNNDRIRAGKIPAAVNILLDLPGIPVKITIKNVMRIVGVNREALSGTNSPLTREVLFNSIDSSETYFERLTDWAIKSLSENGETINIKNIGFKLGRKAFNKSFLDYLNRRLNGDKGN